MATEIWELTLSDEHTIYFEGVSDKYAAELVTEHPEPTEDGWFCMEFSDTDPITNVEQLMTEAEKLGIGPNELFQYLAERA